MFFVEMTVCECSTATITIYYRAVGEVLVHDFRNEWRLEEWRYGKSATGYQLQVLEI
jgi:hypothetical protein